MASKYNKEQKAANIKIATQMAKYTAPHLNREGNLATKQLLRYDPHHIKRICGLNIQECQLLGIMKAPPSNPLSELIAQSLRKGFRKMTDSIKEKTMRVKERKTQRIARRAARGA
jgi:hypothetical protein